MANLTRDNIYKRLYRAIKAGYVYKQDKRYYLTSAGKTAYDALCIESDKAMNEIKRYLLEEIRRNMDKSGNEDIERLM